jgi:hypothetical protein
MTAIEAYERHASRFQGFAARWPPKVDNRQLQTGTGKLYTTAISTAAITAVIFSLVDRSMASSERDANFSAALYAASRAYAVTVIALGPATSRVYRRVRLSTFGGGGARGGLRLITEN